ncbi:ribonuclease domain-containing protein [Skeletonema marinoi]|uniref:Ribonuclease domain-containing protein n=1 Tax=Skeletonema marinoi TaxID=267567 RepID=A0AAD9DGW0_9STRA|nr:ribonuclease domain-containing protein [Skeletonema marinoi]
MTLLLLCLLVSLSAAFQFQIHSQRSRRLERTRHTTTPLFAFNEYGTENIRNILKQYGFAGRLVTLNHDDLSERPLPAELYDKGTWKLCLIKGLKLPSSSKADVVKPPLLQVLVMDDNGLFAENKVVDIGQCTFIWSDFNKSFHISTTDELVKTLQSKYSEAFQSLQSNILTTEDAMQNLYNGRIANRSRPPAKHHRYAPLTKKQIPKIAAKFPQFNHLEELLRNLVKVGEDRSSRMVDSVLAMDYLYTDFCREGDDESLVRRVIAATVLTEDATSGGRFKRRSCQFVECSSIIADGICKSTTLVNGGWIALDPSVRAGTEGRKFAAATKQPKDANTSSPVLTAADERIAHRLECLAMGDVWKNDKSENDDEEKSLELDVREALSSMALPLTADGATRALVQLGRWSQNDVENKNKKAKVIEPWSAEVIDAARKLVSFREIRQVEIASAKKKSKGKPSLIDGRVDLSSLPCVCVDAKRATFRDDSIGIRLRSSTGRKVTPASKWEILIHIADVSNIYYDGNEAQFKLLREAAERRGQSRYDLPFGPLHLLPPKALSALALSTDDNSANECVTVWAYIDERDGRLIEAGLERTIIGSPKALSFDDATNLLEIDSQNVPKSLTNTRAIITVAERNLSLWSQRRTERSETAQKREKRLATKEFISQELRAAGNVARDDGVGGSFQRSRGHRLVDSSLDLYAVAITSLMKQKKKPVPRAAGSGVDRGGRLGTAPLRRYIDGMCQKQAIAVLCGHGKPLSLDECKEASKLASRASDTVANLRSTKKRDGSTNNKQRGALHKVARHISSTGARKLKAVSSGHNNEVVILGTGAVARCRGVKGTLKGGEKLLIEVITIDPEKGLLDVRLTS